MNGILAIFGAGGHARVVADTAEALGWTVSLFDDNLVRQFSGPWRVTETIACLRHNPGGFDDIGNNATRLPSQHIKARGGMSCTLVPPRARFSPNATLEPVR